MGISCPFCEKELEEVVDTTYSNYNSKRCYDGQYTGNIYWCEDCECKVIDDFVNSCVREWNGG